jgi:hypothetical protein
VSTRKYYGRLDSRWVRVIILVSELGVGNCAGYRSPSAETGDSKAMKQDKKEKQRVPSGSGDAGAAVSPCGPVPGGGPGHSLEALRSADLGAVAGEVQPALEGAGKAAAGIHKWSQETGLTGAVFDSKRYGLGGGTCVEELEHMVADTFPHGSGDHSFKVEVQRLTEVTPAKIGEAFDAWVRRGPEEEHAVAELAARIAAGSGKHSNLQVFVVKGGIASTRNAGVALVDPATRETIWFFGHAVRAMV